MNNREIDLKNSIRLSEILGSPDTIPMPKAPEGVTYWWFRRSCLGVEDKTRIRQAMVEGWVPVPHQEDGELGKFITIVPNSDGNCSFRGLELYKINSDRLPPDDYRLLPSSLNV